MLKKKWLTLPTLITDRQSFKVTRVIITVRAFSPCMCLWAELTENGFCARRQMGKNTSMHRHSTLKGHCFRVRSCRLKGKVGKQADASLRWHQVEEMCGQASMHVRLSPCCRYIPNLFCISKMEQNQWHTSEEYNNVFWKPFNIKEIQSIVN